MFRISLKLNEKLRKLRLEKELSLRDLGKESGILLSSIASLERGATKNPQIENLCKLSVALDISLDELIKDTEFDFRKR